MYLLTLAACCGTLSADTTTEHARDAFSLAPAGRSISEVCEHSRRLARSMAALYTGRADFVDSCLHSVLAQYKLGMVHSSPLIRYTGHWGAFDDSPSRRQKGVASIRECY